MEEATLEGHKQGEFEVFGGVGEKDTIIWGRSAAGDLDGGAV